MENKQHIKKKIHKLMQVCEDSARGYRHAADQIDDSGIKSMLYKIATERTKFIGELQDDIRQMGIEPERIGSVSATLRRIMLNIRAALGGVDAKMVLDECEKGEREVMKAYEQMLRDDLPGFIKQRLEVQHKSIVEAFNKIRNVDKKREG